MTQFDEAEREINSFSQFGNRDNEDVYILSLFCSHAFAIHSSAFAIHCFQQS